MKQYRELCGMEKIEEFKKHIISEINDLHIEGLPKVEDLNMLPGSFVNLEYRLLGGEIVKFLDDEADDLSRRPRMVA